MESKINISKKQKQTPQNREQACGCQWWRGGAGRERRIRNLGLAKANYYT